MKIPKPTPKWVKSNDLKLGLFTDNFKLTFIFSRPDCELVSAVGLDLKLLLEQMQFVSKDVKCFN